jgi:NDP-hexose-3-ketoreductase
MNSLESDTLIRVGVLGYSGIAARKFIPALMQSRTATLTALGSRRHDKAALPALIQPPALMGYQELVSDPSIDLVYISLPNHLHEEWSIRALEQGRHVICEKPLALTADSVIKILEAAERHGRLLFENLMYLQHPQHAAVKSLIASGRIGRVLSLHVEFVFPGPAEGDFRLDPASGGGAFHDLNRYPLSAALHFLSGRQHRFLKGTIKEREGLNIAMTAETISDEGERFSFEIAFGQPYRSFYLITGERGTIRVERAFTTPAEMENRVEMYVDGKDESFSVSPCDHFLATIDHVCSLIRNGKWEDVHDRTRRLAGLAQMVINGCTAGGGR